MEALALPSPLAQLDRLERAIQRFFGPSQQPVDQHELAMSLWSENPEMPLYLIRLRCITAARRADRDLEGLLNKHSTTPSLEVKDLVNLLCSNLSPSAKHLLYLRFWKGLGMEAVAQELGWSLKLTRWNLRCTLETLRAKHELSLERTPHHAHSI